MGKWKAGLCGCFRNVNISLLTYIAPCYVAGKNAEEQGYSCKTIGLLFFAPFVGCYFNSVMRAKIRQKKHIPGNRFRDCVTHTFCTYCALVQDAQELEWWKDKRPPTDQKVSRK